MDELSLIPNFNVNIKKANEPNPTLLKGINTVGLTKLQKKKLKQKIKKERQQDDEGCSNDDKNSCKQAGAE